MLLASPWGLSTIVTSFWGSGHYNFESCALNFTSQRALLDSELGVGSRLLLFSKVLWLRLSTTPEPCSHKLRMQHLCCLSHSSACSAPFDLVQLMDAEFSKAILFGEGLLYIILLSLSGTVLQVPSICLPTHFSLFVRKNVRSHSKTTLANEGVEICLSKVESCPLKQCSFLLQTILQFTYQIHVIDRSFDLTR